MQRLSLRLTVKLREFCRFGAVLGAFVPERPIIRFAGEIAAVPARSPTARMMQLDSGVADQEINGRLLIDCDLIIDLRLN